MVSLFTFLAAAVSFQGSWTLDSKASDFGRMGAPSAMRQEIRQTPTDLFLKQTLGKEVVREYHFALDGRELTGTRQGSQWTYVTRWEGEALVAEYRSSFGVTFVERWQLSADGKTLTVTREMAGEKGQMVMVFRRDR